MAPVGAGPGLLLDQLGRGPGTLGVEHGTGEPDGEGRDQERHPELPPGNQLQFGHLLRDPDLKGIDGAEGGTTSETPRLIAMATEEGSRVAG